MIDKIRIGGIRKSFLQDYGIDIPLDKIRRYEAEGLFDSGRHNKTNSRVYNDKQFDNARRVLMLTEGIGVPRREINDDAVVATRMAGVDKILTELKKEIK